jgi:iron complex outermembrane receptor protein
VFSTLAACAWDALAQQTETVRTVPVVVTGTRSEQRSFDLPMSIDLVDKARISEAQMGVNASEALQVVPGVVANNRNNYAQDLQISIRGFGSRSTFGVRGLRLYADGIPLTMPDGQGQAANIDLGTARSIEVLRGPFSSLYGNSSGGVISVFTENGPDGLVITPSFGAGSFDTTKSGIKAGGTSGSVNYMLNATRFDSNGYRDYSAVTRDTVNAKLLITPDELTRITVVANYLMQPDTQDPLGLTRAQYELDPRQVGTVTTVTGTQTARDFGVRKSIDNTQMGVVYERQVGQDLFRALVYAGDRQVQQYLGLTIGAQEPASSGGGVVDLDRQFRGLDVRYTHRNQLASVPFTLTFGLNADEQYERRKGWNNFIGTTVGVQGALRRDEGNRVYNLDQYIQGEFSVTEKLLVSAGLRNSQVNFKSSDYFIATGNPDDSGALKFSALTPVAGLLYRLSPLLHAYASFGKGFETPTFAELAYRTTTAAGAGINTDLKPNRTENFEMGVKALVLEDTRLNAALFQSRGDNEITVLSNTGGRSVFQNAGPTTRRGVELMLDSRFGGGFYGLAAATYLEATFDKDFTTCAQTQCPGTNPRVPVPAGNKIPGVPAFTAYGELGWRNPARGLALAMEARAASKVYVNDRNSEFASSYELLALRASWSQEVGRVRFTEFVRVDNVFDRRFVGSVIVNESSNRFYESGAGRSVFAGVSAAISF